MKELVNVRQIPGELKRRWFFSKDFDLIVWLSDDQGFAGFELCYDKRRNEHSIVWSKDGGFLHMAVDDGEQRPGNFKSSPIMVSDGLFDVARIRSAFLEASQALPSEIAHYVLQALEQQLKLITKRGGSRQ